MILKNTFYKKARLPNSRLITLGACESGLVDYTSPVDEFVGLPGGFLYAGAPAVIGSLWLVDQAKTKKLVIDIYKKVRVNGMRPSEALCEAQKEMLNGQPQPYYWAPFYLCGGCDGWW